MHTKFNYCNYFSFWFDLLVRQNKMFENITLDSPWTVRLIYNPNPNFLI